MLRPFLILIFLSFFITSAHATDLDEVKKRGELRHLGVVYANFVTGSGDGFDVALMRGFAQYLGVRYTLVLSDFPNIIRDLLGQDIVMKKGERVLEGAYPIKGDVIATGFTVLPWRQKFLLYSDPVFPSQVLLVAPADSSHTPIKGSDSLEADIKETKALIGQDSLLVMEKTCLDPANYDLKNKGINLKPLKHGANVNEMAPTLLNGEADLALLDVPDVILDLQKWAGKIKTLGPISEEQVLAVAFPPSAPRLREAFNAYLAEIIQDGTYDILLDKYYPGIRAYFPAFFKNRAARP